MLAERGALMELSNRYHHGNLRAALLAEAAGVLESSGPGALSLRGLARSLGVSHAAPGHHFASKAELLSELGADGFATLADALEAAMAASPPEAWPTETGRAYVGFALGHPERYRLMFSSQLMTSDCPPRLAEESSRAYFGLLRATWQQEPEIEAAGYRMAAPELAAWSLVHGAVMLWLDGQLASLGSEAAFVELMDGVLAAEKGRRWPGS
jgi:AcrR family transcriptional regulator